MFLELYKKPTFITFGNVGSGRGVVSTVNTKTGDVVLDADDIAQGSTNKYLTAAEQAKLAGVEDGATADQTGAEVKALYEGEADTNAFTDADKTKLDGIDPSAGVLTGAEIKTAYEAEPNTNAFTDADKTKLDGINGSAYRGIFNSVGSLPGTGVAGDFADVDEGVGVDIVRYVWDPSDATWIELKGEVTGGGGGGLTTAEAAKLAQSLRVYDDLAALVADPHVEIGDVVLVAGGATIGDGARAPHEIVTQASFPANGKTVVDLVAAVGQAVSLSNKFESFDALLADTRPDARFVSGQRFQTEDFFYTKAPAADPNAHFVTAGGVSLFATPNGSNALNVKQFGAKGDGVTDDTAAFEMAFKAEKLSTIRDEYASTSRVVIPPVDQFYLITSDLVIQRNLIIEGGGPASRGNGATHIKFADTCEAGFFFQHPGGLSAPSPYDTEIGADAYGAGRSRMSDVTLSPVNDGMVDFGIVHNLPIVLERVYVSKFSKAGFFAHGQSSGNSAYGDPNGTLGFGTMFGNTNGSQYNYCVAKDITDGHGFAAQGNNTQVMTYLGCDATNNNGCGFRDNSSIGNNYINCHTAQNSYKVEHNGKIYIAIKPHAASSSDEPGVGPNWKECWIEVVATLPDATWGLGATYRDAGGINVADVNGSFTYVAGHYTEGGIEFGIIPRSNTTIVGGLAGGGRIYHGPDALNVRVIGTPLSDTPAKWTGGDDNDEWGSGIGDAVGLPDLFECGHSDDPHVTVAGKNGITLRYSTIRGTYEWLKGPSQRIMAFTTDNWSKSPYSGAGYVFFENGLMVGGPKTTFIRGAYSTTLISGAVEKGEIFVLTGSPAGGKALGYVTVGGTVGSTAVIKEAGAIDN